MKNTAKSKFAKAFKSPSEAWAGLVLRLCQKPFISDETAIKAEFRAYMGYTLDLNNPKSFNEKLQWLKLHDRNPLYTTLVDKLAVKEWVSSKIGDQYIVPTLAVWKDVDEIDLNVLPGQFVIKANHYSGYVAICKDKETFDFSYAKKRLASMMKKNLFYYAREWPYKDVKPLVFAEEYLEPDETGSTADYKVFCFSGEPKMIQLHKGRFSNHTQDTFDPQWNHLDIRQPAYPLADVTPAAPKQLEEMLRLSRILSAGIPHVRVDWYINRDQLKLGEMTFFDASGLCPYENYEDDLMIGSWIDLNRAYSANGRP